MTRLLSRTLVLLAVGATFAGALPASAQPASEGAAEEAATHFAKGNELFSAGDLAGAEAAYEKAFAVQRSFDVAANLGAVKLDLGKPAEAAFMFELALASLPIGAADKRKILEERLADARAKAGTLRIEVEPATAAVRIDDRPAERAATSGAYYTSPGEHRIDVAANGFEATSQVVTIGAGETQEVAIALTAAADDTGSPPPPPVGEPPMADASSEGPVWPIFVGAGLTLALAGAGVGLTAWGASSQSSADDRRDAIASTTGSCPGGCEELRSLYGDADTGYNLGVAFFVASGVAAVGTVAYALLRPSGAPEAASIEARVVILPTPQGATAAAGLEGTW